MSNMSANGEFSAGNRLFAAGLIMVFLGVLAIWLWLHPNSPLRPHYDLFIFFPEIGSLEVGSVVEVSGLHKGKVVSVDLQDSGVWVGIRVYREVKIPKDSRFRIINAGLLGQRRVEIRLGTRAQWFGDGDSLKGGYDMGSTRLAYVATSLLKSLDSLSAAVLKAWTETLGDSAARNQISGLARRGRGDWRRGVEFASQWRDSLSVLRAEMRDLADQVDSLRGKVPGAVIVLSEDFAALDTGLTALSHRASRISGELDWLSRRLSSADNAAGALLSDTVFQGRVRGIANELRGLLGEVRRKGLDLNVDIF